MYKELRCNYMHVQHLKQVYIHEFSFVSRSCSVVSHLNYGKIRIFIHCTVSNMLANESTLVLWLSDLLSMDSRSVSEGVSLSAI